MSSPDNAGQSPGQPSGQGDSTTFMVDDWLVRSPDAFPASASRPLPRVENGITGSSPVPATSAFALLAQCVAFLNEAPDFQLATSASLADPRNETALAFICSLEPASFTNEFGSFIPAERTAAIIRAARQHLESLQRAQRSSASPPAPASPPIPPPIKNPLDPAKWRYDGSTCPGIAPKGHVSIQLYLEVLNEELSAQGD